MGESNIRFAVLGVGNLLLRDEGIGVHVAHALQKIDIPSGVKIIDGGTSLDLPDYLEDVDKLIIIDVVKSGGQPGTIYRFHLQDLDMESRGMISLHECGLEQSLRMMRLTGKSPKEIVIIGIEPKEIDWGTEPSAELQQKIPEIVNAVLSEINPQTPD